MILGVIGKIDKGLQWLSRNFHLLNSGFITGNLQNLNRISISTKFSVKLNTPGHLLTGPQIWTGTKAGTKNITGLRPEPRNRTRFGSGSIPRLELGTGLGPGPKTGQGLVKRKKHKMHRPEKHAPKGSALWLGHRNSMPSLVVCCS